MPIYNMYPYTNLHELNLDQIVAEVESFKGILDSLADQLNQLTGYLEAIAVNDSNVTIDRDVVIDGSLTADDITGQFDISATSADKLNVNGGDVSNPVYFANGVPTPTGNTLTKDITGNAGTSTKWFQPITLRLVGDVTGQASVDGSGNVQLLTTIQGTTPDAITSIPNDLTIDGDLLITANHTVTADSFIGVASSALTLADLTATITELNYMDGVTSPVQSQLNGKQATITGAATTVTTSNLTASRALVSNSSGKIGVSTITSTKLGYLTDVTSNIQAQINAKQGTVLSGTTDPTAADGVNGDIYIKYSA